MLGGSQRRLGGDGAKQGPEILLVYVVCVTVLSTDESD